MINFIIGAIIGGGVTVLVMCCLIVGGRMEDYPDIVGD